MATATAARAKPVTARAQISQLDTFRWEGTDKRGIKMKGETLGKSENLVKADLRKQGITPTKVAKKGKPLFGGAGKKITAREIAIFSRQLATMMKAGVPLVQSFDIIASGQKNPRFREMLIAIKTDIE